MCSSDLLNLVDKINTHLALNAIIAHYALVDLCGGIYGDIEIVTYAANTFYMVGMVVGDKYVVHHGHIDAIVAEILLHSAYSHSGINQQSVGVGKKVVAITTTTTTKRYKF